MSEAIGVHETAVRVLEEESHGHDAGCLVEKQRRYVAYIDKLKADRLYLARSVMDCHETITKNRTWFEGHIADLKKQVAILKEQVGWIATAERLPPTKGRYLIVWSAAVHLARWEGVGWRFKNDPVLGVEYWAELPAVPQDDKEQAAC